MESYRPRIGTPIEALDTPCLLVDLDALEHNFCFVADTYRDTVCKMREHAKNIKTPIIAHKQIQAGGTVNGVCTAKVSEAEVMVEGGISDILITSQVVTRDKIERVCGISRVADVKVAVDSAGPLQALSDAANEFGATVGVIIEVDTSMHRAGVRTPEHGVELAKLATGLPGIAFKGVMSHQTLAGEPDRETRFIEGRRFMDICLEVKDAIEAAGIPVEIVSTGETWTIDVATEVDGVTEVQGGTYALMGTDSGYMEDFQYAARILSTVVSRPDSNVAIGDVGYRALAAPNGVVPEVEGMPEISVAKLDSEQIVLKSDGDIPLDVGDQVMLLSAQQDILVNRWDEFIAVRNGKVEAVWPILARGCYH
ncbi:MAG: alanine racemase [SAR202 cluster bacterium]|jgi:3-hydroxy-D-aspartate aldolase|nr:alanine racemase [SAR202 cluster bacterium]MDP6300141.1 alanine racemase [SAR202 cluster bacterium]MDP7102914.1 alanine racemase [SAR202 cluster bacterium]MDP7225777.1 alanine racemase [SAR202 cluster bacterium]MDP7414343.1 alanine racemase [SAR202 cluster bacterium]|tara:strand:- start:7870 stop:8970 length:1101 start_codon:yes stop_codon:yes gene_type:complete